ncbi:hypothetical protein LCGC14_0802240 [marine sediment metagenome]|uniref:Uncharacterized protein n=1 Tax=marine sediment metagenome TaxID=412755 RepID=A0A0F9PP74_9ZZZZ|nr:hypothetical protein [bacterium]
MRKTHEFELFAYGMAFGEGEFGWFSYSNGDELPSEQIYNNIDKYINEIIPINKETPFTKLGFLKSTHISYQVYLY